MGEDNVLYEVDDGIGRITLHRPDVLNALSPGVLSDLAAALAKASDDPAVGVVTLTGAGERAFSAGADIAYLNQASPLQVRAFARLAVDVTGQIEHLGKPVLAALNGDAFGGGLELAEACAIRVAVRGARLGHPEVRIGAVAGFGGTTRLPRLIGKGRAAELLLTGRAIDAEHAERLGLVNHVVDPDALRSMVDTLAHEILAQAPLAVNLTWEAVHRGLAMSEDESARLGADYFGLIATTDDFQAGTRAFLDKHAPSFHGR